MGSDGAAKLRIQRLENLRASNHNICRHFKVVMFEFEYENLYVISADTVHAGGFCTDEHEGNLRLQLHITIDAKNHPLPIEGYQQKVLENVDYELNENAVSVSKLN